MFRILCIGQGDVWTWNLMFFNHSVTGVIGIILEKVCFPVHSFNNAFNFVY